MFHPLPKQLGQKYGSEFPAVRSALMALDQGQAAERLLAGENLQVEAAGKTFDILADEVEVRIQAQSGFSAATDGAYVAALDTEISQELASEGLAREIVRRIQDLRKQVDFNVDHHIRIEHNMDPSSDVFSALDAFGPYVRAETLADDIDSSDAPSGDKVETFEIDGEAFRMGISLSSGEAA